MRDEKIKVLNESTHLPQQIRPRCAATVLAGCFIAVLSWLPGAYADSNLVIWERGDQIVQLAKQDDASAPRNDHPFKTTPGEIRAMLETLRLRYVDEAPDVVPVSVFTQEELDNLDNAIATGLGRAAASQDVIFHVIGARRLSRGAFSKRNRVSAGRIFYRDGKFNIIFGQVQTPYRKKSVYGQTREDFYPRNYGSRSEATKHDVVFLTNSAARLFQGDAGVRDDWIVMEPGASAAVASQSDARPAPAPASAAAPVALAEAPARPSSPAVSSNSDTAKKQAGGSSAESAGLTADVEERLEALKRLRERELISEEAYQAKMKEILQDL